MSAHQQYRQLVASAVRIGIAAGLKFNYDDTPPMAKTLHAGGADQAKPFTFGMKIVLGVREPRPIVGAPEGRQRLRMRNDEVASLFVKTASGIRSFSLEDKGDHWFCNPTLERGANLRPK